MTTNKQKRTFKSPLWWSVFVLGCNLNSF